MSVIVTVSLQSKALNIREIVQTVCNFFSHLDDKTVICAARVSRAFRDNLAWIRARVDVAIPRLQRQITLRPVLGHLRSLRERFDSPLWIRLVLYSVTRGRSDAMRALMNRSCWRASDNTDETKRPN